MLYPSWPSLVFLLWSCVIWLVPQLNPRKSVFYSSPLLVLYSFILLLIQYAYSLHLFVEEFSKNIDVVPECNFGRKEGCKSIALLAKVSTMCTLNSQDLTCTYRSMALPFVIFILYSHWDAPLGLGLALEDCCYMYISCHF